MGVQICIIVLVVDLYSPSSSSSTRLGLSQGSALSVEKTGDVLISANGVFSAGFYRIGNNAYCFAIWFTEPLLDGNVTLVWMANRDNPVNGKRSKLSLWRTGNLVLTDAGQRSVFWSTDTVSTSSVQLELNNTGNLVLHTSEGVVLWQSFDSPTDTLLPHQPLTKDAELISSRSRTNHSSGFYKLFFDSDNTLRLVFDDHDTTSVYWYDPWLLSWEAKRSTYNNSRIAVLDSSGHFNSSDELEFSSADLGMGPRRRLTLDVDGNVRLYSLNQKRKTWEVTWQAIPQPCKIHGICGANSLCTYAPESGRRCSCLPGYKLKNHSDWSHGCEPEFKLCQNGDEDGFIQVSNTEFYGFDIGFFPNYTLYECKKECLKYCSCTGFQYKYDQDLHYYTCYTKVRLLNGYRLGFPYSMYIRLPKSMLTSHHKPIEDFNLDCSYGDIMQLGRIYKNKQENRSVKLMLWFTCTLGGLEIVGIIIFMYITHQPSGKTTNNYLQVATGFRRFTYAELKRASGNFREEIGRGGGGVVYKAVLSNNRVAAIKRLKEANQGEAEFLAEASTIGRLNHMNLIENWGYCAEGKHRLLVYEYMEHGCLSENLYSGTLDWEKRFKIAVGTAKGLAYLHEECLEWVLHCDVKPQNILLNPSYQPKLADFGLSKLLNRGGIGNSSFSRIRGTRGYMAPEWVFNLPITSKVDVYSYGVVMLEMVTGRTPTGFHTPDHSGGMEQRMLVTWVREKMHGAGGASWIEEIVDSTMDGEYDTGEMKILVNVAMKCVEEDKDARPTMSQVVHMLLVRENDD